MKPSVRKSGTELLLMLFATVTCIGAVTRMLAVDQDILKRLDGTTLLYLGVAGALLLLRDVKTLAFGDYKVEFERVREIAKEAKNVAENAQAAALGVGKRPDAMANAASDLREVAETIHVADPWKGQFGGSNVSGSRHLDAKVAPILGAPDYFKLTLTVRSSDPAEPLYGAVQFFLHPTFRNDRPIVTVGPNGIAELHLTAWGAFTVGAVADAGRTKLELDLAELPDAPPEFKSR
jgi:hypothetical protein